MLDQPDLLKFGFYDFTIKGFHNVFIRTGRDGCIDMLNIIFRGAENNHGRIPAGGLPEGFQEIKAVHLGHVPVQQHYMGHAAFLAGLKRQLSILSFHDIEVEFLKDIARDKTDHP